MLHRLCFALIYYSIKVKFWVFLLFSVRRNRLTIKTLKILKLCGGLTVTSELHCDVKHFRTSCLELVFKRLLLIY